jgi:hypothetical protein
MSKSHRAFAAHQRGLGRFMLICGLGVVLATAGCGPGDAPEGFFFFALTEDTPVEAELTAVAAESGATMAMKLGDELLDQAGHTALIGMAVEGLHNHPEWIATVPGGGATDDFTFSLSFRLTTPAAQYETSDEYTLSFALFEEAPEEPEETEILIGSRLQGNGQLAAEYDFATPVALYFDQCVGGTDDECAGGVRIYSATNPGFAPHE